MSESPAYSNTWPQKRSECSAARGNWEALHSKLHTLVYAASKTFATNVGSDGRAACRAQFLHGTSLKSLGMLIMPCCAGAMANLKHVIPVAANGAFAV